MCVCVCVCVKTVNGYGGGEVGMSHSIVVGIYV